MTMVQATQAPHDQPSRSVLGWVLMALLFIDFVYSALFSTLPANIRVALGIPIYGIQVLLCLPALLLRPSPWTVRLFLILILFLVPVWVSHLLQARPFKFYELIELAQFLVPYYTGVLLVSYRDELHPKLIYVLSVGVGVYALAYGLIEPPYYHAGQEVNPDAVPARFMPFHDNPHSSGYVLFSCIVIVHQLLRLGYLRRLEGWTAIAFLFAVMVGYLSTQVIVTALVYFLLSGVVASRIPTSRKVAVLFVMLLAVLGTIVLKEQVNLAIRGEQTMTLERLGTGRFGTWMDRIDRLVERQDLTVIFGTGPGSDMFSSRTWRFKQTSSHQTFLTITLEYGFFGLVVFFVFFSSVLRMLGKRVAPLVGALMVTCLLGNGIPLRPMPHILFWCGMALAARVPDRRTAPHTDAVGGALSTGPWSPAGGGGATPAGSGARYPAPLGSGGPGG